MSDQHLPLANRLLFGKSNPLRYLRVPKEERLNTDGGPKADASSTGTDDEFNREGIRNRGDVVAEDLLQ